MPSKSHVAATAPRSVAVAIYGASHAIKSATNHQCTPHHIALFIYKVNRALQLLTHLTFALRHAANNIVTRWFQVDYIALQLKIDGRKNVENLI